MHLQQGLKLNTTILGPTTDWVKKRKQYKSYQANICICQLHNNICIFICVYPGSVSGPNYKCLIKESICWSFCKNLIENLTKPNYLVSSKAK